VARYIKYVGTSHWREITEKQWAALDPPVEQKTLRWEAANGWTLNADRISDDAWPYIDADPELVMVEKDYRQTASTEDSAEADPVLYPPLTTAAQAEDMDVSAMAAQSETEHQADAAQNDLPDQESGSVEGPVTKD
jgi:hypothetical protein